MVTRLAVRCGGPADYGPHRSPAMLASIAGRTAPARSHLARTTTAAFASRSAAGFSRPRPPVVSGCSCSRSLSWSASSAAAPSAQPDVRPGAWEGGPLYLTVAGHPVEHDARVGVMQLAGLSTASKALFCLRDASDPRGGIPSKAAWTARGDDGAAGGRHEGDLPMIRQLGPPRPHSAALQSVGRPSLAPHAPESPLRSLRFTDRSSDGFPCLWSGEHPGVDGAVDQPCQHTRCQQQISHFCRLDRFEGRCECEDTWQRARLRVRNKRRCGH